jgi:hypothetical protein
MNLFWALVASAAFTASATPDAFVRTAAVTVYLVGALEATAVLRRTAKFTFLLVLVVFMHLVRAGEASAILRRTAVATFTHYDYSFS